jgi:hypothetical protein
VLRYPGICASRSFSMGAPLSEDAYVESVEAVLLEPINQCMAVCPPDPARFIGEVCLKRQIESGGSDDVRRIIECCTELIRLGQGRLESLHEKEQHAVPSTRSGFLLTLSELVGNKPSDRTWHAEWVALNLETARVRGFPVQDVAEYSGEGKYSYSTKLRTYDHQVQFARSHGASLDDAEASVALGGVCSSIIADSVRNRSARYAASAHALYTSVCNAAQRDRMRAVKTVADTGTGRVTPVTYKTFQTIHGQGGLVTVDQRFATLATPDGSGFRGFTCPGEIHSFGNDDGFLDGMFPADGKPACFRVMNHGVGGWLDLREVGAPNADVVAFVNRPPDESGFHDGGRISSAFSYHVPINSLVSLLRFRPAGTWVAPNGVRPACGCYEVSVTYHPPASGATQQEAQQPRKRLSKRPSRRAVRNGGSRLLADAQTLSYANRSTYARGLVELEQPTPLTLEQEWQRDDRWTAYDGTTFSAAAELAYVLGVAGEVPHGSGVELETSAGSRDAHNAGTSLMGFVERANAFIDARAVAAGMVVESALHHLSREEVLAIRLYTGPAYQPINRFLRELGKLSAPMRVRLARTAEITYAATVRAICGAIRKIARVDGVGDAGAGDGSDGGESEGGGVGRATAAGDGGGGADECTRRWRGVRGALPPSFYVPDAQFHTVDATELGLMSTSTKRDTPVHYMQSGGQNVLWEVRTRAEDESGFHSGADVSVLSQFAHEREELFPPLTKLRAIRRGSSAAAPSQASSAAVNKVVRRFIDAVDGDADDAADGDSSQSDAFRAFMDEFEASYECDGDKTFLRIVVEPTFV